MNMIAMLLSWILSWKKLGPLNDFKYLWFTDTYVSKNLFWQQCGELEGVSMEVESR